MTSQSRVHSYLWSFRIEDRPESLVEPLRAIAPGRIKLAVAIPGTRRTIRGKLKKPCWFVFTVRRIRTGLRMSCDSYRSTGHCIRTSCFVVPSRDSVYRSYQWMTRGFPKAVTMRTPASRPSATFRRLNRGETRTLTRWSNALQRSMTAFAGQDNCEFSGLRT